MSDKEWLAALKPGDEVAVSKNYGAISEIMRVSRVTGASIFVVNENLVGSYYEVRFSKSDGWKAGGSVCNDQHLHPVTDGLLSAIAEKKDRTKLSNAMENKHKLPIETVRAILAVLEAKQ